MNDRRQFLSRLTWGVAGTCAAAGSYPLLRYLAYAPSRETAVAMPVPHPRGLEPGGAPVRITLRAAESRDAWLKEENGVLGAAWLVMGNDRSLRSFSAACPHLGCAVGFDAQADEFRCPCHDSAFARDGTRLRGPAKRGLDPLPLRVEGDKVLVTFERFVADTSERRKA